MRKKLTKSEALAENAEVEFKLDQMNTTLQKIGDFLLGDRYATQEEILKAAEECRNEKNELRVDGMVNEARARGEQVGRTIEENEENKKLWFLLRSVIGDTTLIKELERLDDPKLPPMRTPFSNSPYVARPADYEPRRNY